MTLQSEVLRLQGDVPSTRRSYEPLGRGSKLPGKVPSSRAKSRGSRTKFRGCRTKFSGSRAHSQHRRTLNTSTHSTAEQKPPTRAKIPRFRTQQQNRSRRLEQRLPGLGYIYVLCNSSRRSSRFVNPKQEIPPKQATERNPF